MLNFQYIEYFIAMAAIPLLFLFYFSILNWKKKAVSKMGDKDLIYALIKNYSAQRFFIKFILITLSFATAVFGLANLRTNKGTQKITRNGIDIMIALDVSKSMLAQDVKPTRLGRSKQLLKKLIDKLGSDRVGLVIFAGRAYLQMPLTADHTSAKIFIDAVTTDAVPTQGTVIADALKMCASSFNTKDKKYKSVILISDGEDHDENAHKIASQLAEEGIAINTIGIGSPEGSTILDPITNEEKKDNDGNTIVTKINEEVLIALAKKGNGLYQLYNNTDKVITNLTAQLNSMDQRVYTETSSSSYKYYFQFFLIITLLLLCAELLIPERKNIMHIVSKVNKKTALMHKILLVLLSIITPILSFAQNDKLLIKKGNKFYNKNEFGNAIENYKAALDKNPANAVAQYNLGNASYKNKKTSDALLAYDNFLQHTSDPLEKSKAYYNKGVVLQNNNKINECIDAYKKALKLSPGDDDARQNLQKALQQQKQQQQKKENQEKEKKNPEENKGKEQQKPKEEDKKQDNIPDEGQSKLTRQDAEEKLKALQQQEKTLQDKLKKVNASSSNQPTKDW